ncbi:MAG: L,D-transpeptidase family protein [Pseudomonadota bacterium]
MRKTICLLVASTFLTATPVISQPASAQSLMERLFPRVAERRKERRLRAARQRQEFLRRQQRSNRASAPKIRVKKKGFKTYVARSQSLIGFAGLAPAFTAFEAEQKTRDEAAVREFGLDTSASTVVAADPLPVLKASVEAKDLPLADVTEEAAKQVQPVDDAAVSTKEPLTKDGTPADVNASQGEEKSNSPTVVNETNETGADGVDTPLPQQALPSNETAPAATPEEAAPEIAIIAPKLRLSEGANLLSSIKIKAPKALAKAVLNHYQANPTFIWLDDHGRRTPQALAVELTLANADQYGLYSSHYTLPSFDDAALADDLESDATAPAAEGGRNENLLAAMQYEFAMTVFALRYMNDARHGLVDPNRVSDYHDFKGLTENHEKAIQRLVAADEPASEMLAAHPRDKAFTALKTELVGLRAKAKEFKSVSIKKGTFVRPGQVNDQLPAIVEAIQRKMGPKFVSEYFDAFALDVSDGVYNDTMIDMVKGFQKATKLKPDGIIGRNTLAKMTLGDPNVRMNKVLYAMERLRWHPDSLGPTHVLINQPAYRATLIRNNAVVVSMRTVVGKPSNQTNFFYDEIEYVEYNPYWGVPRSILVGEMLPKLRNNASYLDNLGYEITNTSGRRVSSSNVDWWSVGSNFPYNVRQPPGPKNALGELKIMFPNKHSIYMHDTPSRHLFSRSERAYSHGCVRLAEPQKMAAAVLGTSVNDIVGKISQGRNQQQRLSVKMPVYVSYYTAWPTQDGKVEFFGDVYGRDTALGKALALESAVRTVKQGA